MITLNGHQAETNGHDHLNGHQAETNGHDHMLTVTDAGAELLDKIATRQAVVAVIGMGYVGLPLAVGFAEAGFRVVGIDVDKKRVASLNAGQSHIPDVTTERIKALVTPETSMRHQLMMVSDANGHAVWNRVDGPHDLSVDGPARRGRFWATTDFNILCDCDAVVMCVPTPLSKTKDPDMSYIVAATDEVAQRLHHGMLVVLESTTYPGTTEEVILPRLEQAQPSHNGNGNGHGSQGSGRSRLVVGRDFFLAFSPERIDPGRSDWTVRTTPKVIGGVTPGCLAVSKELYACAIEQVVPVSLPKTAEMVKLLENTFRAVNIAMINEMAIMCERLGVDVWEVIEAAKTKPFGFMPFYPGPGLGGHCIPIDPQYLAWKLKTLNYNARFIQLAEEVNFNMPHHVLAKIGDALNRYAKALKGSRVLILGMAYKADVSDMRESPALDLAHLLREKGSDVSYNDPFVPRLTIDGLTMNSVDLSAKVLQKTDCVVITTAHSDYDWEWIVANSRLVVDTRNATRSVKTNLAKIVRL